MFPATRMRRLRANPMMRRLVRETALSAEHLVAPLFVREGKNIRHPISSMPGQFQFSVDRLLKEAREIHRLGIGAILLFGIPSRKDARGAGAYDKDGIIQRAVREIKNRFPEMLVITDLCFCEYTDHGHCGIVKKTGRGPNGGDVDNDATLELLAQTAITQAEAGADLVAPSATMDGQVRTIRKALDENGFSNLPIMSYSAKFASSFYGPFRQAAESPPKFGDRKSYQMDPPNAREALREIALDIEEGADIVMVKPAMPYLDIIRRASVKFSIPLAAYNVSGEYAMVKAAASRGWIDESRVVPEILTSIRRAGADILITYHAKEMALKWL